MRGALVGFSFGILSGLAMSPVMSGEKPTGAREMFVVAKGDTIFPAYSVQTDTALFGFANGRILIKQCKSGTVFLRTWRRGLQTSADTITLLCPSPLSTFTNACDSALYSWIPARDTSFDIRLAPFFVRSNCPQLMPPP